MNNLKTLLVLAALILAGCSALDNPYDENNPKYTEYTLDVNDPTDSGSVSRKPDKNTYKYGETVTVTAKAGIGYEFVNWSDTSMGKDTAVTVRMTKNETLTANFRLKQTDVDSCNANPPAAGCPAAPTYKVFTITFNANGGKVSPASGTTGADSTLEFLPFPDKRECCTFDGWYTANTSGTEVTTSTVFSASKTVYAKWKDGAIPTFTITFNANDGNVTPDSGTTTASGTLSSLPTPTKSGYDFDGWFTAATSGTKVTTDTVFTNAATIYAQWTLARYTIKFNANDGTVTPDSGKTGNGWKLDSLPTPTRIGYTFNGWFTAATGGDSVKLDKVYSANATIYAKWNINQYTITFDVNGGNPITKDKDTTGTDGKLDSLPTPIRSDYTFGGWITDTTGGTAVNTSTVFSANTTIYAQWTLESTFVDSRDNTPYKRVQIGTQIWMAENLNHNVSGSVCYRDSSEYCEKYGQLYDLNAAMAACPAGWHLPTEGEWKELVNIAGNPGNQAATKLKSADSWGVDDKGQPRGGTDDYGFSALPGGYNSNPDNGPSDWQGIDNRGAWWSASGQHPYMTAESQAVSFESSGEYARRSVRCVKN